MVFNVEGVEFHCLAKSNCLAGLGDIELQEHILDCDLLAFQELGELTRELALRLADLPLSIIFERVNWFEEVIQDHEEHRML